MSIFIKNRILHTLQYVTWIAIVTLLGCQDRSVLVGEESVNTAVPLNPAVGIVSEAGIVPPRCPMADAPPIFTAEAHALFNFDHVPTFDLYLPREKWDVLTKNAADEKYTKVEACFEGYRIGDVGLRFKGSYGTLFGCFDAESKLTCPRLSMKLNFQKYDKNVQFFGLQRLNFNANRFDDSRMREKLAYDLYRSMDIVAPQAFWAVVRVNGKSYGLYTMVEQIDGNFTESRWPDNPSSNLYKEVWPTETNPQAIAGALKSDNNKANISGFRAFSSEVANAKDDTFVLAVLGKYSDLDYWARYLAVDEAILSYDGVIYFFTEGDKHGRNHNYYFYEDSTRHFTLVPWDVESSFWINPNHAPPHWTVTPEDCRTTYPYWEGLASAPGCDPLFSALALDGDRWYAAIETLLDGPFSLAAMHKNIDRYDAIIGDIARSKETPTRSNSFDEAVQYLRGVMPELRERLEAIVEKE